MKLLFFLTLIVTQMLFSYGAQSIEKGDNSFLFTKEAKYFFGTAKRGNVIDHIFKLENRSSDKIIISEIKMLPNCHTTAVLPIEIIPGGGFDLKVSLDTSGSQGVCKSSVTLLCEYPSYYEKTLFISGKILSDIKIFPRVISFDDVFKGSLHKKRLTLKAKNSFVANVKQIIPSSEFINAVFNTKDSSDQNIVIDVVLSPDTPLGDLNEEIIITTNEKLDPERRIKVTGKIVGDVQIEPDNLNFGMINGQNSEKIIYIKPYKGKTLNIRKIISQKGEVATKLVTIRKGREYMILVKPFDPHTDNPLIDDIIEIHTNSNIQPVIEIKIAGNFSDNYIQNND